MRARPVLLLAMAAVIAVATALLANSWLKAQRMREIAQTVGPMIERPSRAVLVARGAIGRGEILRPDELVWQTWPDGDMDSAYIAKGSPRTPESFAGWVAINPLTQGEPITLKKVIAPGDRGFLAAVLRPGMRAVSVPVTVTSGISGFIFPGDRVDLLLTYSVPSPNAEDKGSGTYEHRATETFLRDLRVIAIDQRLQAKPGEAILAHTATFEVTPKQAEAIALAGEIGKLSLSLHSLVPGPSDPAGSAARGMAARLAVDTPIAAAASYTIDDQISPLLPKAAAAAGAPQTLPVTILHGLNEKRIQFPLASTSPVE